LYYVPNARVGNPSMDSGMGFGNIGGGYNGTMEAVARNGNSGRLQSVNMNK
jgi:hypothetical protein